MPAVHVLTSKGWAVQLVHNATEPKGDDHGFILVNAEDGTVFVDCPDFQHNRKDYYMKGWEKELATLLSSIPDPETEKGAAKDGAVPGEELSDVSTADPDKEQPPTIEEAIAS
jgi:hypothetical protein